MPALAPEEVEKLVSFPIESEMAGLPSMVELRSLSKSGLSQVTMTFRDGVDIFRLRLRDRAPPVCGGGSSSRPDSEAGSHCNRFGEIFYYALQYASEAKNVPPTREAQLVELRQIQDYLVKPLLRNTSGVAEVNTSGGYERQIIISLTRQGSLPPACPWKTSPTFWR